METCGQIACSVGRLPIRFTVGTGGTIRLGTGGDLRSDRVRGGDAGTIRDNPETCGQIACSVGRLPIRFTVGTGGTITVGTDGDLRSDRVHGGDAGTIIDKHGRQSAWMVAIPGRHRGLPLRV